MKLIRKLTFLLIMIALAWPATMAGAADMQDCPHMSSSNSVSADKGDVPCHTDQGQPEVDKNNTTAGNDGCDDCGNNCDSCGVSVTGTLFFSMMPNLGFQQVSSAHLPYQKSFKSIAPEALRHPPKSFS